MIFPVDVLLMKLSHRKPLFRSAQPVETGRDRKQGARPKRGPHPQAWGHTLGRLAWLFSSRKHLDRLRVSELLDQVYALSLHRSFLPASLLRNSLFALELQIYKASLASSWLAYQWCQAHLPTPFLPTTPGPLSRPTSK